MKHKNRFVVYADFLGTTRRYRKPTLIVRSRELLEQALARYVVPRLNEDDMYLYVHSDTAIVTCPRLIPLLGPISNLFSHFIEMQSDDGDKQMTLALRAAISYGKVLVVDHLQNSERIRTIPFLDTSLPMAYRLESIRKGSRVFVDPAIPDEEFRDCQDLFIKWQQITGRGIHVPNVREYLWPAKSHCDGDRLAKTTLKVNGWWIEALSRKQWSSDDYHESTIHLDETLKLFIRTASRFCTEQHKRDVLFSLLPKSKARQTNICYKWGVWFQALRGIIENCDMNVDTVQEVEMVFEIVKTILSNAGYLEHFMSELEFPDYARFRSALSDLGLHFHE
jgi:hypothetical protein